MDISFAYFGARMKEICTRHHVGPMRPTLGHLVTCYHTEARVSMTPHQSKETHLRPIISLHGCTHGLKSSRDPNRLQVLHPPRRHPRTHLVLEKDEGQGGTQGVGRPLGLVEPPLRTTILALHVVLSHWSKKAFSHHDLGL
jgi:hypothetical protein